MRAVGAALTTMSAVAMSTPPESSVTLISTVCRPAVRNACVATLPCCTNPLIASKFHSILLIADPGEGVEVDVKVTVCPGSGAAGDDVKPASGLAPTGPRSGAP